MLTELARRVRKLTCPNCNATVWALPTSAQVWCEGCASQFSTQRPRSTLARPPGGYHGRQSPSTDSPHGGELVPPRSRLPERAYPYFDDADPGQY